MEADYGEGGVQLVQVVQDHPDLMHHQRRDRREDQAAENAVEPAPDTILDASI